MSVIGVIPARLDSERFPRKILTPINGKPMVMCVAERAMNASLLDEVIIAVDSEEVYKEIKKSNVKVVMTAKDHLTGSDRMAEVVENRDVDIVVNIQGDEPMLDPKIIDGLVNEFDDSSISDSEISTKFTSFSDLVKNISRQSDISTLAYNKTIKSYTEKWHASNRKRASAAMEFLFNSNNKNTKTHFAYFGRSKSSVLLNAIKQVLQKQSRTSFLNKNLSTSINHDEKFVYFPLGVDQEHNLLIGAPFYTNQLETIRHVAKSIPINYKLYVKEHPSSATRNWKSVSDYKEIMNIPNVRLLHPSVSQDELFQNCSLVVSAMGSSCLEAAFYGKPSVIFGKLYYSILPSVHHVETLSKLPEIIRSSLQETVNLQDVERFLTIFKKNSFDFDLQTYYLKEANEFFYNGHLVDVKITEPQMKSFIEENAQMFSVLVDEYIKKLKIISSK